MQEWKDIEGFEGLYQINRMGQIKSAYAKSPDSLIKNILQKTGYFHVMLCKGEIRKQVSVHRLLAKAFIPNPENKPFINHINGNRADNRLENLEWCTHSENLKHAHRIGLKHSRIGGANVLSKRVLQMTKDGAPIKEFASIMDAERELGVRNSCVSQVCIGNRKTTGGFAWKFI